MYLKNSGFSDFSFEVLSMRKSVWVSRAGIGNDREIGADEEKAQILDKLLWFMW